MSSKIEILERALKREKEARKLSEKILEQKSLELYTAQKELEDLYNERTLELNKSLQKEIHTREEKKMVDIRFSSLIENMSDIFFTVDETGHFTYINSKGIDLSGYSREEFLGSHFTKFIPKKFHEKLISNYIDQKLGDIDSTYIEFPFLCKNESIIWLGQKVSLVKHKNYSEFVAIARNINEQINAKEVLKKSEEKYRSIIENMELGVLEVDNDGLVVEAYPKFCKMTKYDRAELIGQNAMEFLLPSSFQNEMKEQMERRAKGNEGIYEVKMKCKDGEKLWVIISAAPAFDELGNVKGSVGIHLDISDRKKFEKDLKKAKKIAEDAAKQRELFVANVSHELRTPLNAILGMVDQIEKDEISDPLFKDKISTIEMASGQLSQLINDVLSLSKIDSENLKLNEKENSLHLLAKNIIKEMKVSLSDPRIDLVFESNIGEKDIYNFDSIKLFQVLNNLLTNAIKYTDRGQVTLLINRKNRKNRNSKEDLIQFRILDTGIGIKSENLNSIFSPFTQLNNKISKNEDGVGLGLAITKRLVEFMKGKLFVKSELNKGSEFYFEIPMKRVQYKLHSKIDDVHEIQTDFKGKEVLVLEDNVLNQKVIRGLLTSWNMNVTIAGNGKEGLDLIESKIENFDIIIVDLKMPIMNGFEFIENLNEINLETPCIALTANSVSQLENNSSLVRFENILMKPIDKVLLNNVLKKILLK
jgi:PAS domain S-box-containing protein